MKKILKSLIILIALLITIPVNAANYEVKELIPINVETSVFTDHFSYTDFYYNDNKMEAKSLKNNFIIFKGIRNITSEDRPVTVTIGLFDKDEKNIGTINYCSKNDETSIVAGTILKPKEEKAYVIEVNKKYLADGKTVSDIKYISILSDNMNCNVGESLEYVGETVDEIGMAKNTGIDKDATLSINVLLVVGAVLLVIFVYQFMFTSKYQNMDGDDVRQAYKTYNKQLEAERDYERRVHPEPPKEVKKVKTDKVLKQEQQAQNENKSGTDLHNMYK